MNYLLDTNILVIYLRNNEKTKSLDAKLQLSSGKHDLFVSTVSVGEIKSIAIRNQ